MSGHAYGWSTERIVEPGKGLGSPFSAVWTPIGPVQRPRIRHGWTQATGHIAR